MYYMRKVHPDVREYIKDMIDAQSPTHERLEHVIWSAGTPADTFGAHVPAACEDRTEDRPSLRLNVFKHALSGE